MTTFWELKIEHNYYRHQDASGIDVRLTPQSWRLLQKRGLFWKQVEPSKWLLFAQSDGRVFDSDDRIEVELGIKDDKLPLVTNWHWDSISRSTCRELEIEGSKKPDIKMKSFPVLEKPIKEEDKNETKEEKKKRKANEDKVASAGVFFRLILPAKIVLAKKSLPVVTKLVFDSVEAHWEYVFIPRDGNTARKLALKERSGGIVFGECKQTEFMEMKVLTCRSVKPIILKEVCDFTLQLWEVFTEGKKEILHYVPTPDVPKFQCKKEIVIRQVVYF